MWGPMRIMPSSSLDQRGLRTYLLAYGRLVECVYSHSSLLCMCGGSLSLERLRPLTRAGTDVGMLLDGVFCGIW